VIGLLVIVLVWDNYGISWDESARSRHGELLLDYFLSFGRDHEQVVEGGYRFYTALPDLIAAALYRSVPQWKWAVRHTVSALFALATVPAVFKFARSMGRPRIGLMASVFLMLTPAFLGHAFINSKDIPLACAFAWAMVGLAHLFESTAPEPRRVLYAGLGLGFPLMIRPTAWTLLFAVYGAALVFRLIDRNGERLVALAGRWVAATFVLIAVAWSLMISVWPWAHQRPLFNPIAAIWVTSSFPRTIPVLYRGSFYESDALPHSYLLEMLVLKLPIGISALAIIGLVLVGVRFLRHKESRSTTALLGLMWPLAPIAGWTLLAPNIYDGIRHFLFVLPAIAIWAAFGLDAVASRLADDPRRRRIILLLAVPALMAWPVREMVRLHPYEMTYYNPLVGGLDGAAGSYETDYWVTSYREAAEWLSDYIEREQPDRPVSVLVASTGLSLEAARYYLRGPFETSMIHDSTAAASIPDGFDYYIGTTRFHWDENFPESPILYRVGRDRAVFAVIRGREAAPETAGQAR
jgi:hypothetical protein